VAERWWQVGRAARRIRQVSAAAYHRRLCPSFFCRFLISRPPSSHVEDVPTQPRSYCRHGSLKRLAVAEPRAGCCLFVLVGGVVEA